MMYTKSNLMIDMTIFAPLFCYNGFENENRNQANNKFNLYHSVQGEQYEL